MNEVIYIKEELKNIFAKIGIGIVDSITIYRIEDDKYFFKAGQRGKFHLTKQELEYYRLS